MTIVANAHTTSTADLYDRAAIDVHAVTEANLAPIMVRIDDHVIIDETLSTDGKPGAMNLRPRRDIGVRGERGQDAPILIGATKRSR